MSIIVKGYDGSRHAPTSEVGSKVKTEGHKKEDVYANRVGGNVIKGTHKPDVSADGHMDSVKGAKKNIQLLANSIDTVNKYYDINHPLNIYQHSAYKHRKFKEANNNNINLDLFDDFLNNAKEVAEYLRNKDNFRKIIEKVFSDGYEADRLVILKEITEDAYRYDMREVVDLYVNSNYKVHVTDGAKIVVSVKVGSKVLKNGKTKDKNRQIFYIETRGGKNLGQLNHGVRAPQFYSFLQENLNYEVIPK